MVRSLSLVLPVFVLACTELPGISETSQDAAVSDAATDGAVSDAASDGPVLPRSASCADLPASTPDGVSLLQSGNAYCETQNVGSTNNGPKWTLVLKADGTKATFAYASGCWGSTGPLCHLQTTVPANTTDALAREEAKYSAFDTVAGTEVRVRMVDAQGTLLGDDHFVYSPTPATLASKIESPEKPITPTVQTILPQSPLQEPGRLEGLSLGTAPYAQVRIGIIGFDNPDNAASWIGVGGAISNCGASKDIPTVGNWYASTCGGESSMSSIATFAYVYVR